MRFYTTVGSYYRALQSYCCHNMPHRYRSNGDRFCIFIESPVGLGSIMVSELHGLAGMVPPSCAPRT
eukprot:516840-Rhodomonas_salina.8